MHATTVPASDLVEQQRLKPPTYGSSQRQAIDAVVDSLITDIVKKIGTIRATLDTIEQRAIQSSANAKGLLTEHVQFCHRLDDEITHMEAVVKDMYDQVGSNEPEQRQDVVYRR